MSDTKKNYFDFLDKLFEAWTIINKSFEEFSKAANTGIKYPTAKKIAEIGDTIVALNSYLMQNYAKELTEKRSADITEDIQQLLRTRFQ
jgi:hypothetical protein